MPPDTNFLTRQILALQARLLLRQALHFPWIPLDEYDQEAIRLAASLGRINRETPAVRAALERLERPQPETSPKQRAWAQLWLAVAQIGLTEREVDLLLGSSGVPSSLDSNSFIVAALLSPSMTPPMLRKLLASDRFRSHIECLGLSLMAWEDPEIRPMLNQAIGVQKGEPVYLYEISHLLHEDPPDRDHAQIHHMFRRLLETNPRLALAKLNDSNIRFTLEDLDALSQSSFAEARMAFVTHAHLLPDEPTPAFDTATHDTATQSTATHGVTQERSGTPGPAPSLL